MCVWNKEGYRAINVPALICLVLSFFIMSKLTLSLYPTKLFAVVSCVKKGVFVSCLMERKMCHIWDYYTPVSQTPSTVL